MKCFGLTDKGSVRSENQDCFIIQECTHAESTIIAICDGMGGAQAGEIASQLSNKCFTKYIYDRLLTHTGSRVAYELILKCACEEANGVAYEYSRFDDSYEGMGTTLVGGIVKHNGEVHLVNVGDSRAYLIYDGRTKIKQITKDHSLVERLIEVGAITREMAKYHPQRNVITRAVGSESDISSDYFSLNLKTDDILILCSDGLSNIIPDDEILSFGVQYPSPEILCNKLMEEALLRQAKDNVTVLAVTR